jgi:hypothetical protein
MSVEKLIAGRKVLSFDPIAQLVEKVGQISASRSFNDEKIGQYAISTESLGSNEEQLLTNVYNNIESTIKTITQDFNISTEAFQLEAASIGGILGSNPKMFLASKPRSVGADMTVMVPNVSNSFMERPQLSTEAYDERDNRNAQLYSIIYNLLASRQDDFGETFFPTIVVNPNEVGVTLSVKLFYVYNDFKRSVTGSLANYARKSVIRAYADAEILKNEMTKAIPVLRTGGGVDDNSDKFVAVATVPSWSVNVGGGIVVPTGALKVDQKVDLIGLSQTNELLNSGIMGPSDTLDTYLKLESVFLSVVDGANTSVIKVAVDNIPGSTFTYAPQGNSRRMMLSMDTDGLVLDSSTVEISGAAPDALAELATHKARIQMSISGNIVLDKSECLVNRGSVSLVVLRNAADQLVTGATFNTLAAKFAAAEIIGYTVTAFRANSNIRQRGQLLDSQTEYRVISVPYRSPLSVIMPAVNSNGDDNSALQTLITTTGIRVSNEAVSSLLKAQVSLAAYKSVADPNGDLPEVSAIGHYYVKPTYFAESMDLALTVDNLKSHEKLKDIRAAIVEKIRYFANAMFRDSEYKAAASVLTGNTGFKPTVIVGTDPVIYNYIMADGDLRTLGETFDVRVVSTLDTRVAGKIFISFGVFDSSRNTSINPLNFGNMLWSPELTISMPVSRDGQTSRELIVAPRFLHNVNLPMMTVLSVSGLPAVMNKVPVNMHSV